MAWRRRVALAGSLAAIAAAAALAPGCGRGRDAAGVRATLSVTGALGAGDTAGYARALAPRAFHFPADHGPHPGFRNEWWYFTGNLVGDDGRVFGYELTFFRTALSAGSAPRASDWGAREVYMAHFAITDSGGQRFEARDRFARAAAGLAGAQASPWRVWLDDWVAAAAEGGGAPDAQPGAQPGGAMGASEGMAPGNLMARGRDGGTPGARGRRAFLTVAAEPRSADAEGRLGVSRHRAIVPSAFWPITLTARDSGVALSVSLGEGKPPVLQGDRGLSRKGPGPGNASYYYSLTRMPTAGWLEVGGRRYRVAGESWMDREWSTSALGPDEVGWDWFALRLSDGRELMLYRIRRRGGGVSPFSAGTLVASDGSSRALAATDAAVDVLRTWSSRDGARYPAEWRVRIPSAALDLHVRPVLADQELKLAVRYWEGAVWIEGTAGGRPVGGRGYVELTGYAAAPGSGAAPGGKGTRSEGTGA